MRVAVLAIGSELLGTDRLDTNSLRITETLERHGAELVEKAVVGDDKGRIASQLAEMASRCELIVVSGGLGPTRDDLTRQAVAAFAGLGLHLDEQVVRQIEERFRSFGREMPAVNRRQAMVIDGARLLANPNGTAPGQCLEVARDHGKVTLFLMPGVPRELQGMVDHDLEPWLVERLGARAGVDQWELRVACLPESAVEERLATAYEEFGREAITVLAKPSEILVRVRAPRAEPSLLEQRAAFLRPLLGDEVFSEGLLSSGGTSTKDGKSETRPHSLEETVGHLLVSNGQTVVCCESCTGGMLGQRLTSVAGSSAFFLGGVISYTNELKHGLLAVPESLFARHGAVSRQVAEAMAVGGRDRLGADWALSITGVAGPDGGSDDKPVGTVDFGIAGPDGQVHHRRFLLPGDRERVRRQSTQYSLELLRRSLLKLELPASRHPSLP